VTREIDIGSPQKIDRLLFLAAGLYRKRGYALDERLRFVARLLEGEKMAPLCREFGIYRVTGYKIFDRYQECGPDAPGW
jgi:hypothetical protein